MIKEALIWALAKLWLIRPAMSEAALSLDSHRATVGTPATAPDADEDEGCPTILNGNWRSEIHLLPQPVCRDIRGFSHARSWRISEYFARQMRRQTGGNLRGGSRNNFL